MKSGICTGLLKGVVNEAGHRSFVRSYLKAAYYSGLSSASPVLQTVALVWNVGYHMRTKCPSAYVYAIENSPS